MLQNLFLPSAVFPCQGLCSPSESGEGDLGATDEVPSFDSCIPYSDLSV